MTPVRLCWFAGAMLLCAALGFAGLDQLIATRAADPAGDAAFATVTGWLDLAAGKEISTFLLGFALILAGGALAAIARTRPIGWSVLFVGAAQFAATIIADLSKPPFGRLRPRELTTGAADTWFVGGNSFPSGHTAFYAGLALPLVVLFPRAWPILAVPLFVATGRVMQQDHYLSDVAVSLALAALVTALTIRVFGHRLEASRRAPE